MLRSFRLRIFPDYALRREACSRNAQISAATASIEAEAQAQEAQTATEDPAAGMAAVPASAETVHLHKAGIEGIS